MAATSDKNELDPLSQLMGGLLRRFVERGKRRLGRAAERGRTQLERAQVRRDLDHFWARLGKTAYNLVEAGEIDHPALTRAKARIDELEDRIRQLDEVD